MFISWVMFILFLFLYFSMFIYLSIYLSLSTYQPILYIYISTDLQQEQLLKFFQGIVLNIISKRDLNIFA